MAHTNLSENRFMQILRKLQMLFYPSMLFEEAKKKTFAVNATKDTTRKVICALYTRTNHLCSLVQLLMRSSSFAHSTLAVHYLEYAMFAVYSTP